MKEEGVSKAGREEGKKMGVGKKRVRAKRERKEREGNISKSHH